ncbi:hypothetical protein BaRGS_00023419 [Batillaria attramentaria]|uniref:Sterile alpha and TIR motif-containing protein 1 n=1 Tax=Batillaria attramentaria TaxID=370345 RepID=A0ABD0KDW0_9CAEN
MSGADASATQNAAEADLQTTKVASSIEQADNAITTGGGETGEPVATGHGGGAEGGGAVSAAEMGKTTDGGEAVGTEPTPGGTPAQDGGSKQDEDNGAKTAPATGNTPRADNGAAAEGGGKANDDGDGKPAGGNSEAEAQDGEKAQDEVNFNDSVSNVKSQPERNKDGKTSKDVKFSESKKDGTNTQSGPVSQTPRLKRAKKGIFVSYSPDAGFLERRFVVELVRQLKENNLAEDLWFDKDEKNTDSPCWFSLRMEAVEKCRAAILIFSDSYFSCPVSVYEGKVLLERHSSDPTSVTVFPVLFSAVESAEVPKQYLQLMSSAVDLTGSDHMKKSSAEKTSVVIGAIMEELEKFATMNAPPLPFTPPDTEFTGEYKKKKICQWNAADLQEWLFSLGIKEFYRQSLAESMVDGFLLMSLTDRDMVSQLGIDSRVVRKKIMQQILATLDKEHKQTDNWHLRARAQRPKPDIVYLIYDPADVRLAQNLKADLKKKSLQVIHHDSMKLGRSKEEFLQINGPHIATATHVVVLMTDALTSSPFIFHEVLFADWLGKKIVTAMFKNVWTNMRYSLKAVLGECPAVDFETKMYAESLDVLEHHIKPLRRVPGVVLEQTYLNKMADGLKPLEMLASTRNGASPVHQSEEDPKVFISYQWDMQSKVDEIRALLERSGFACWADIAMSQQRGHSSRSSRSSATFTGQVDSASDTLQGQIQRSMRHASVVLCCITPKYLQSDNCIKDLSLAETFNKPIVPLLLRFTPFESAPSQVRRILLRHSYVDLSNERLYKQNIGVVMEKVKKAMTVTR